MANTNTTERINFATSQLAKDYPDFLDIQVKSFQDFFQLQTKAEERGSEGLYKTFMDNFPITDTRNQFVLEFLDYFIDPPRYTIQDMRDLAAARDGKCLSTEYKNQKTKLLWECDQGHRWETSASNIKKGTWCPHCYRES